MRSRRVPSAFVVVVASFVAVFAAGACVPGAPHPDAGTPAPVCLGGGDTSVRAGHTGVDFVAIQEGDELPAWTRPQGGIGTRLNFLITGIPEDNRFGTLTTQFLGPPVPAVTCTDNDDPACGDLEVCDDGKCRALLGDQTNVVFPLECLSDGSLQITELPMRFSNQFELAQLDGVEQELRVTADPYEGEVFSSSVQIILRVGDFIQPSWWETGEP